MLTESDLSLKSTLLRRESNYLAMHFGRSSHWRRSSVFIANFEHIPHLVLVLLLLTLQVNAGWDYNLTFMYIKSFKLSLEMLSIKISHMAFHV